MTPFEPEQELIFQGPEAYMGDDLTSEDPLEALNQSDPYPSTKPPSPGDLYPLLGEMELGHIRKFVDEALQTAKVEHGQRLERNRQIYRMFRRLAEGVAPGDEDSSGITVPLIQWSVFDHAAKEFHAIYGDGAKIIAEPANPETSSQMAKRVGMFMSAQMMKRMKITKPIMEILTYRALFGRAYGYRKWENIEAPWIGDDGIETRKTWYSGPTFKVLWDGDVIYPYMRHAKKITDHPWHAIRHSSFTVEDLLREEEAGNFHGIKENLNDWYSMAGRYDGVDWNGDELNEVKEEADGTSSDQRQNDRGGIVLYEVIIKRCLPLTEYMGSDIGERDYEKRELYPRELAVWWAPCLHRIIGVRDLVKDLPRMRNRSPIWETALAYGDGYHRPGMGELLHDLQDDLTSNERQFTDTGRIASVGFGMHEPGAGLGKDDIAMEAGVSKPVADISKTKWININANFEAFVLKKQSTLEIVERVTGQSDFTMGRGTDRPTQPRTATGQSLLIQAGSVRMTVSLVHFNEDLSDLINDSWQMEMSLGDPEQTFRVLESDALTGLMDQSDGRAKLTPEEREGNYTFSMRFAATEVDRAIEQQNAIQAYTFGREDPLIATNPAAMWQLTKTLMDSLGQKWFAQVVAKPISISQPKEPDTEWALMLNGEEVEPNMADDHQKHYIAHQAQYQAALRRGDAQDADAVSKLETHLLKTIDMIQAVIQQQQLMNAMAVDAVDQQTRAQQQEEKPDAGVPGR